MFRRYDLSSRASLFQLVSILRLDMQDAFALIDGIVCVCQAPLVLRRQG